MITGTLVSEVSYFCVYIFGESAGVEKTTTAACTSALQSLRNQLIIRRQMIEYHLANNKSVSMYYHNKHALHTLCVLSLVVQILSYQNRAKW